MRNLYFIGCCLLVALMLIIQPVNSDTREPRIITLSVDKVLALGGEEVFVTGENFTPDIRLSLGDSQVKEFTLDSPNNIRFRVPAQIFYGERTLTIQTKEGIAQRKLNVIPKPLSTLEPCEVATIAGRGFSYAGDGEQATSPNIRLEPLGVGIDRLGNILIKEENRLLGGSRIRRLNINTGIINTIAGMEESGFSGDGGLAITAKLNLASFFSPGGIALDTKGNLFFTDTSNNVIRRIDSVSGIITTVAGSTNKGFSGDGGLATKASLSRPSDIVLDKSNNLFISDQGNKRIRRVDANTGIITTIAGTGKNLIRDDGVQAISAGINPLGLAIDLSGNLLFVDIVSFRIRKVDLTTGIISTVAGNGKKEFGADGNIATNVGLEFPGNIALDKTGNLFISERNSGRVRRVDINTRLISTVAGSGKSEFSGDGGLAINAGIDSQDIALDSQGNLIIVDKANLRVRKVDLTTGIINTIAGNGKKRSTDEINPAINGCFFFQGLLAEPSGNILFSQDNRIRRIDKNTSEVTIIAGTGRFGFGGDGGLAINADIRASHMVIDANGDLLVADRFNNRIRKIDKLTNIIETIAGNGADGFSGDGGLAKLASLSFPQNITLDKEGNIFFTDSFSSRIRRIDTKTGIISTIAGSDKRMSAGDGGLAKDATFKEATAIAFDKEGNLFIVDRLKSVIRRIDAKTNIITRFAGTGGFGFSGDGGFALNAKLDSPKNIVIDDNGNLFIADFFNNRIRHINLQTNIITTIAGTGKRGFNGDNAPAIKADLTPDFLALDSEHNLFFTNDFSCSIQVIKSADKCR